MGVSPATLYTWRQYVHANRCDKLIPVSTRPDNVRNTTLAHRPPRCSQTPSHTFPFPVRCVYTDYGRRVSRRIFDALCKEQYRATPTCRHIVTPPRSPKLQGSIERLQGTWRQEFWNCTRLSSPTGDDLTRLIATWQHQYTYELTPCGIALQHSR